MKILRKNCFGLSRDLDAVDIGRQKLKMVLII